MSILYRRARLADEQAGWPAAGPSSAGELSAVLLTGERIGWIGPDAELPHLPPGTVVHDLDGRLMLPGFVDAHVHVTETGLALDGIDLSSARSAKQILTQVAKAAADRPGRTVIGHGWDELRLADQRRPTAAELDQAAGGADVYLSRIDVHSALVSSGFARRLGLPALDGWDDTGRVERDAHHAARHATRFGIGTGPRRDLQLAALKAAAAAGISELHECSAPHVAPEQDLRDLLALTSTGAHGHTGNGPATEPLPRVVAYWGELATSTGHAREIRDRVLGQLGPTGQQLAGLAGDLMADGSFGSHTAALLGDYHDAPGQRGHLYLDEHQVATHVMACTQAGLQAGFHAIGDRAVEAVLAGFRRAALGLGPRGPHLLRAARHRVEHLEALGLEGLGTLRRFGVLASVQPVFDAEWGGPGRMYERRLGTRRTAGLNPFAAMAQDGIALAFGSDSPVTPFGPWTSIRAAVQHRTAMHRLDPGTALRAHLGRSPRLRPGDRADLSIWDAGPLEAVWAELLTRGRAPGCHQTVAAGRILLG